MKNIKNIKRFKLQNIVLKLKNPCQCKRIVYRTYYWLTVGFLINAWPRARARASPFSMKFCTLGLWNYAVYLFHKYEASSCNEWSSLLIVNSDILSYVSHSIKQKYLICQKKCWNWKMQLINWFKNIFNAHINKKYI